MGCPESQAAAERRYSARWTTDKVLWWRPHHCRRPRCGKLVQRSLTSLVFQTSSEDAPEPGSMVLPSDWLTAERHGFREAVVRRVSEIHNGRVIFTEILA